MARIGSVIPWAIQVGQPGGFVVLHIYGSGFVEGDRVSYDGQELPADFISDTELRITLDPEGRAAPGYVEIKVPDDETPRYLHWTPGSIHGPTTYYGDYQ